MTNDALSSLFGKLIDETEVSSDIIQFGEEEEEEEEYRSNLNAVHQIVRIPSCRDVLAMLKDRKCIRHNRLIISGISSRQVRYFHDH